MAKKSTTASKVETQSATQGSQLTICRNKHWRHISAYHGPWLQLPIEILESLAHQNWTMPSPRLIDPAVFFDMVKIRRYVDGAAHDSVRAATGISNIAMSGRMDYFGAGGGPSSQLSKERIFRIRQKAAEQLAKAYALDEIAASVVVMQATSTLEDVAAHVLKREPNSHTARYVHFFHEKVPSRAMEQATTVEALDDILSRLPWEERAAILRTRSYVHFFKESPAFAIADLNLALRTVEELKLAHKNASQELELASKMQQEAWKKRDCRNIPRLKDEDQPTSLERQLLFRRASYQLFQAQDSVDGALRGLKAYLAAKTAGEEHTPEELAAHAIRLDARKRVKTLAKRALKDYMAFLSHLEYTPGLPYELTNEIMQRMYELTNASKSFTGDTGEGTALTKAHNDTRTPWPAMAPPKIYRADQLFMEKPVQDLPPFPATTDQGAPDFLKEALLSREVITYHPLLVEALHSLLLCHALLQTSPTELQRHAYNVARLARINDGYPIFQSSRSKARIDWADVLSENTSWLKLSASWYDLTRPDPLPDAAGGWVKNSNGSSKSSKRDAQATQYLERASARKSHEAMLEALSDERVVDEESFQMSLSAHMEKLNAEPSMNATPPTQNLLKGAEHNSAGHVTENAAREDVRQIDHAFGSCRSKRAELISRWVAEAPLSLGTKKKRPARKKKVAIEQMTESVSTLSVADDDDVD